MKVIVTGASKGIGRGIVQRLAAAGHQVGLLARDADALRTVQEEITAGDVHHPIAPCDIRDPDAVAQGVGVLVEALGGVDALINNAGLVLRKSCFDISVAEWQAVMETNVHGLFYATRAILGPMRDQGAGHIINISSISGKFPLAGGSAYAASKYAVTGFSQSLFQEVRDHGIKVTVVFPGSVDSESHRHDPDADHGWKVRPEEVGQACLDVLNTRPGNCVSEVEIRPLARAPK